MDLSIWSLNNVINKELNTIYKQKHSNFENKNKNDRISNAQRHRQIKYTQILHTNKHLSDVLILIERHECARFAQKESG